MKRAPLRCRCSAAGSMVRTMLSGDSQKSETMITMPRRFWEFLKVAHGFGEVGAGAGFGLFEVRQAGDAGGPDGVEGRT